MSVTYIYNSSTVNLFSTEDLGSITSTPTTEDYGSISAAHTQEENYYEVQYVGDVTPFGTATIGGSAGTVKQFVHRFSGSGRFRYIFQEASTFFIHAWIGSGSLFEIGGGLERIAAPYLGADPLQGITLFNTSGSADESFGTTYTIEDATTLSTEDFGSVSVGGSSVDYGQITNYSTGSEDYGTVSDVFAVPYQGNISITGSASESFTESGYVGTGSYGGFSGSADVRIPVRYEGSGSLFSVGGGEEENAYRWGSQGALFTISGETSSPNDFRLQGPIYIEGGADHRTAFRNVSTGSLFGFSGGDDSVTRDYDEDNVVVFSSEDYGAVTASATSTADYGSVTQTEDPAYTDFGQIQYTGNVFSTSGGYTLSGSASVEFLIKPEWTGSGSLFAIGGEANAFVPNWVSTGLFSIGGSSTSRVFREYDSTGSLFASGGEANSHTVVYNDSISVTFSTEDRGLITSAVTTSEDLGSVSTDSVSVDNGQVVFLGDPFGTITITGTGAAAPLRTFVYTGDGSSTFSGAVTNFAFVPGPWVGTGLFAITGGDVAHSNPRAFQGFGSLSFGEDSTEKATKDYNDSTIDVFSTEDRGLVSASTTSTEDQGLVTNNAAISDLGSVSRSQTDVAATANVVVGGSAVTANPRQQFFTAIGGGILFSITGGDNRFVPGFIGSGSISLSGSAVPNFSLGFIGDYTFTILGGNVDEQVTWDWNDTYIDLFTQSDFGSLQSSATTNNTITDVDGNVDSLVNYSDDFGTVTTGIDDTRYDFGVLETTQDARGATGTYSFTGAVQEDFIPEFAQIGTGLFAITGFAPNSFFPTWNAFGTFTATGDAVTNFSLSNSGTGALFANGIAGEAITSSYNLSSIDIFTADDYGTITTAPSNVVDYEYVTELATEAEDYGTIFYGNQTNVPFGLFRITGAAETAGIISPIITGSGGITIGGTAGKQFAPNWNVTGLFAITGSAVQKAILRNISTGTLFTVGGAAEKVAFDYNLSSSTIWSTEDNGSVATTATATQDNGSITAPLTGGEVNNGYVVFGQYNGNSFGGITISGSVVDEFKPEFAQIGTGLFAITGQGRDSFFPNWNGSGIITTSGGDSYNFSLLQPGIGRLFTNGIAGEAITKHYNISSSDIYSTEDYGSITSVATSTEDYQSVTDPGTSVNLDFGNLFTQGQTNEPFGLFRISGSAQTAKILRGIEVGSGSLFTASGAAETFQLEYTTTGLFRFSGTAVKTAVLRNISTGTLFTVGGAAEKVAFDYNQSSIVSFSSADNGLVSATATSTEDNGAITSVLTGGEVDNGSVVFDAVTGIPFGSINLGSGAGYEYKPEFAQIGTGLFAITGQSINSFLPNWNGSGTITTSGDGVTNFSLLQSGIGRLFTNGIAGEAITKHYNISSVDVYSTEDYGFIATTATTTDDYGSVTDPGASVNLDFGNINTQGQTNEPFGLFQIGGAAVTAGLRKPSFSGSGTAFIFRGAAESFSLEYTTTGLFGFSGSAVPKAILRNISTGTLFTVGGAAEAIVYDYNQSSIAVFTSADNGSVATNATSTDDNGSIDSVLTGGEVDNGFVVFGQYNGTPFGTITISSNTIVEYKPEFGQVGDGLFAITGQATDAFIPNWNGSGTIATSGDGVTNFSLLQITTGGLFAIGGAAEAVAFDYNLSSIDVYSAEDYGSITGTPTSTEDYELVADPGTSINLNYGGLSTQGQSNTPFGLFQIGGAGITAGLRKPSYVGSGSLFTAGGEANSLTSNPPENTVLFTFNGIGTIPNFSFSQPANAFLTIDIESEERRVYDYNEDTVTTFSSEDLGLITNTATNEDNGQLSGLVTEYDDRGLVIYTSTVRAASGTITLSGTVTDDFIAENKQVGSGTVVLSGSSEQQFIPNWVGTGLFGFSGGDRYNFSLLQITTGGLFTNGIGGEAVTKHYSISSTTTFTTADYGALSGTPTTTTDYGTVTTAHSDIEDFGLITVTQSLDPFGLFQISGSADTFFQPFRGSESTVLFQFSGTRAFEQFIPNWNASGTITLSGTAGQVAYRNFPYAATGALFSSGIVGEAVTKAYNQSSVLPYNTEDYGAIASAPSTTEDYGQVADPTTAEIDYGHVYEYPGFGDPFGTITISGAVNGTGSANFIRAPYAAFGNFTILSNILVPMQEAFVVEADASGVIYLGIASAGTDRTRAYDGSGSLFSASGAAESKTTNKPESTVLFAVSGSAETPRTRPYIGSGSLFALSGAAEAVAVAPETTGIFTISGTADTDRTRDFVGSGSLFSVGGAAEAVAVAPEATGLFTISGSGDPPVITLKFFGGGTITLSGAAETPRARDYVGSGTLFAIGGAAESKTSDEEFTGLYTFSGTAEPIIRTRAFQGSGRTTISGAAVERQLDHYHGSGVFQVTGIASAQESFAPAAETGSGSLFSASGAAESKTSNPPENTILYTFAGTAEPIIRTQAFQGSGTINISGQLGLKVILNFFGSGGITLSGTVGESFTPATEVGSGSITLSGTKDESFTPATEVGSGSITLSGSAVERQLDHYTGSGTATISGAAAIKLIVIITGGGSLFSAGGAAESKTTNKPESTVLFAVSGVVGESFGKGNYTASGTSTFAGAGIEKQTDDYVGTGSATLSGTADTDRTRAFAGSGSLFSTGGAAEVAVVDYESVGLFAIVGSANEAIVPFIPPGSGSAFFSGSGVEKQTDDYVGTGSTTLSGQATDIKLSYGYQGTGGITLSGSAVERQTDDYVGTGSLFATNGAAESKTTNKPESTVLFSFSGTAAESATFDEVSAGGTIVLSGQATNVRFNRGWEGSGTATFSGIAGIKLIIKYPASGSLFSTGGAAESKTTNKPESTVLYEFSGTAGDQKLTFSEVASGTITLSGSAVERQLDNYTGSGVFTLSGAAETPRARDWVGSGTIIKFSARQGTLYAKVVDLPEFSGLFSISGTADTDRTRDFVGSGSFGGFAASAESITSNPPENTILYRFTGASTESRTNDYIGSGSLFTVGGAAESATFAEQPTGLFILSGAADTDRSRAYTGSGTLFGFSGAAESATVSEDATGLFTISGAAETPRARDYVGSGSLFAIGGASESKATNYPSIGLFQISGTAGIKLILHYSGSGTITLSGNAAEAFIRPTYVGSGSFGGFSGSATESKTNDEEFTGTTTISGEATDIKVAFGYQGSGSLFTASGTGESATVDYENTVLFTFTGGGTERFVPGGFIAAGQVTLSGDAATELRIFQPAYTFVTII